MLEITVFNSNDHFQTTVHESAFTVGACGNGSNRIVVEDELVSDYQCRCELIQGESGARLKLTNLGRSMVAGDNSRIHHHVTRELELPCVLGAGQSYIEIVESKCTESFDRSIRQIENIGTSSPEELTRANSRSEISPSPDTLSSWFEALGQIQRSTAGEAAFFELAARCVFNPGGLDGCIVLQRQDDDWVIVSQHIPIPVYGVSYRKDLVQRAYQSRLPLFHDSALMADCDCTDGLHASVVCPVFDGEGEVVAMVYGFRRLQERSNRKGIRHLEAKFVSVVADSISAGIIRLNHEADRARKRVLLEQAFSPAVAARLESNPDFLNGQDREVTVLFADLRGFCRISESVGASLTYQLLTDVMNRFTQIVHDHHGVIIDFYGDGMSAFWNAPVDQPDHPMLACKAGVAIIEVMTALNDVWSVEIGQRLRVGVGIHTGNAQVGNSGSQNRLKYGPQGSTVNIASRLEQATKKLGVNVVVSGATAERLSKELIAHRICTAELGGISEPTDVFHLVRPADYAARSDYYVGYEQALQEFESGDFPGALATLTNIAQTAETSQPMLSFLLETVGQRMGHQANQTEAMKAAKAAEDQFVVL